MEARIFKPAKNAMQSGRGRQSKWLLEYEPASARSVEPLMGWTSTADTASQVRVSFDSREEAEDYARRHDLSYSVTESKARTVHAKSYADNFRYDRVR